MTRLAGALLACCVPAARAHALQDRYDLPLPMAYVVAGGCAVVVLTFLLAAFFARAGDAGPVARRQRVLHVPRALLALLRGLGLVVFAVTVAAALWGTQDPLMNLAPTMVWIVAWLGLTFLCAFVVDAWPALDPWRTLHGLLRLPAAGIVPWPRALGCWPAVALLLAWSWLEIVYPVATTPRKLGWLLVGWSLASLAGMACFGRGSWQARADFLALAFALFGRMAPWRLDVDAPGEDDEVPGRSAFVMAMLATVIFDGLHAAPLWTAFEAALRRFMPLDANGHVAGTLGLLLVWLAFVLLFHAAARPLPRLRIRLALTLLPIAAAYVVAHNVSTFVLQGQRVFALVSDPFGRQWDLFGTVRFYPDISLLDARATWFIAVAAITCGHAASVWWSHRVVLAAGVPPRRAARLLLPLTALMVAYTAVGLLLLASAD